MSSDGTVRAAYVRGTCSHCARVITLTVDGVVRRHNFRKVRGLRCPGSWEKPLPPEESSESTTP